MEIADQRVPLLSTMELTQLCAQASVGEYRYWIEKQTRSRVWLGCQRGGEHYFAVLPCFPPGWGEAGPPLVVLHILRLLTEDRTITTNKNALEMFQRLRNVS